MYTLTFIQPIIMEVISNIVFKTWMSCFMFFNIKYGCHIGNSDGLM